MYLLSKTVVDTSDSNSCRVFIASGHQFDVILLANAERDESLSKVEQIGALLSRRLNEENNFTIARFDTIFTYLSTSFHDFSDITFCLVAIIKNTLLLKRIGGGEVYLWRNNQIHHLSHMLKDTQSVSGLLNPHDRVILLLNTKVKVSASPDKDWLQSLAIEIGNTALPQFSETVTDFLHLNSLNQSIAAVLISDSADNEGLPIPVLKKETSIKRSPLQTMRSAISQIFYYPNKKGVLILGLLIVLLLIGIIVLYTIVQKRQQNDRYLSIYIQKSQQSFDQALKEKNTDPQTAREDLASAKNQLQFALNLDAKNAKVKKLQDQIAKNSDAIIKIYHINNPAIYLGLNLIKNDFSTHRLASSGDQLLLLSQSTSKTLALLNLDQKSNIIVSGGDKIADATLADLSGLIGFVYTAQKGILKVDTQTTQVSPIIPPDLNWGRIVDLVSFSGNLYLLDSAKNQIYKYSPTDLTYIKTDYLKAEGNFQIAKRLQIDGSVWVLDEANNLKRFTNGEDDGVALEKIDPPLSEITSFYTAEDTQYLYLLAASTGRIVVLTKDGRYICQYIGEVFKTATDLVVLEKEKKLYLLSGNKIYQIDL